MFMLKAYRKLRAYNALCTMSYISKLNICIMKYAIALAI